MCHYFNVAPIYCSIIIKLLATTETYVDTIDEKCLVCISNEEIHGLHFILELLILICTTTISVEVETLVQLCFSSNYAWAYYLQAIASLSALHPTMSWSWSQRVREKALGYRIPEVDTAATFESKLFAPQTQNCNCVRNEGTWTRRTI